MFLFQMLTNAVLLLLYAIEIPTAPILVDRISVPASQDIQAMEKHAKVGLKTFGEQRGLGKSFNSTSCGNKFEETFLANFSLIRHGDH